MSGEHARTRSQAELAAARRKRHKYGVSPRAERTVDGIVFDSKKEARYYQQLKLEQKAGEVLFWVRQPVFDLIGGLRYRADFLVIYADGTYSVIDVKGYATPVYRLKKRQVEAMYPIKIKEV